MGNCYRSDIPWTGTLEINKNQFMFKHAIGKGSFGLIWKAEKRISKTPYAIKVMDKTKIYNMRSVDTIINEKDLLASIKHPFIVNMNYAFQEL